MIVVDDASLFTRVRSVAWATIRPDLRTTIGLTTANGLLLLILFELSSVDAFGSFVEEYDERLLWLSIDSLSLWIDESLLLVIVLLSSSRTLCDNLLPLPHNLLKILRRLASSSVVLEEEGSTNVADVSDTISTESMKGKIGIISIDRKIKVKYTSRRSFGVCFSHCYLNI